jgi:hypothetical protein
VGIQASIGAVAAGVMAVELQKLLAGDVEHLLSGRQVMIEMRHHTHYVTRLNRNSQCRFNHQMWQIEKPAAPPSKLTFDQAVQLVTGTRRNGSGYALGMEGHSFTRMQFCPHCGNHVSGALCLADRIPTKQRVCTACGWSMVVRGFDMIEWLEAGTLSSREGRRLLSSLGFRPGDVFTVRGPHGDRHFELDGRRWAMAGSRRAKGPTTMVTE